MIPTRMGPKDMEEIGEEEIFDDFADALQLRPLERRCRDAMSCRAKKKELHGFHGKGYMDSSYSILQM